MSPVNDVVRFNPVDLEVGEYKITVKVTGNGLDLMSSEAILILKVVAPNIENIKEQFGSVYWLLLMLSLFNRRARV